MKGWEVHTDGRSPIHVWPVDDLAEHDLESDNCRCRPQIDLFKGTVDQDIWRIMHNSFDGRELSEGKNGGPGESAVFLIDL